MPPPPLLSQNFRSCAYPNYLEFFNEKHENPCSSSLPKKRRNETKLKNILRRNNDDGSIFIITFSRIRHRLFGFPVILKTPTFQWCDDDDDDFGPQLCRVSNASSCFQFNASRKEEQKFTIFLTFFLLAGVTKVIWESRWLLMMESLQPPPFLYIITPTYNACPSSLACCIYFLMLLPFLFLFSFLFIYVVVFHSNSLLPQIHSYRMIFCFSICFFFFFQFLFLFEFCLYSTISQQSTETKVSWGKENHPPTLLCGGVVVLVVFLVTFINMALAPY